MIDPAIRDTLASNRRLSILRVPLIVAILAAAIVLSLAASAAQAGRYHVYSCRTPSGQTAPTEDWQGSATGPFQYDSNNCSAGGSLMAALGANLAHNTNSDIVTWAFSAPPNTTINAATIWRSGDAVGSGVNTSYGFWEAAPANAYDSADVFDQCVVWQGCSAAGDPGHPLSSANRVDVPGDHAGGTHLYMNAFCGGQVGLQCGSGKGDVRGYAAVVDLFAADFILRQDAGPVVSNVGGELATTSAVSGATDLLFAADDGGPSGVYQTIFTVDSHVAQTVVLDNNDGRCRDVGQTSDGLPAFLYTRPCQASVHVDIPFDTTQLPDGSHHLLVTVTDAAGNSRPVLSRTINVANHPAGATPAGIVVPPALVPVPGGFSGSSASVGSGSGPGGGSNLAISAQAGPRGAPNGDNPSDDANLDVHWANTSHVLLTTDYGQRHVLVGRLTGRDGHSIANASVEIAATPSYPSAERIDEGNVKTGADGRFSATVPGTASSRTVLLRYRSHLGDALPSATRTLELAVRASITLTIAPHVARVGRRIAFRGLLRGGPIPPAGKQLVLEARRPRGGWMKFNVIRTDARGRFRATYRFHFAGPASYQFRVLSKYEAAFPFMAGTSRAVGVRER